MCLRSLVFGQWDTELDPDTVSGTLTMATLTGATQFGQ